jgi:hypothetical protein
MKRLILMLLLAGFSHFAQAGEPTDPLMASSTVVWAGLDYSRLHIFGDTNDIKVPELFFQDMPQKWNDLFLDERIEGVANSLGKRVLIDIGGVSEGNARILTNKDIFKPDMYDALEKTMITREDIAATISSYKMEHTNGLGLVFMVDSMFYHHEKAHGSPNSPVAFFIRNAASVNVVFFDIATRQIISVSREVNTVDTGESYRSFWFGPIKDTDSGLSKYR